MHLQQDPQGPELSPVTRLHAVDPQYAKDLNYTILEKRKTTLKKANTGKNINTAS
jgi:hypothetical protein